MVQSSTPSEYNPAMPSILVHYRGDLVPTFYQMAAGMTDVQVAQKAYYLGGWKVVEAFERVPARVEMH